LRYRARKNFAAHAAAAKMPPLPHWPADGRGFDIMASEVCDWLCAQAEIRQAVFNGARKCGAIEYDVESKRWAGVNFNGAA
jgi:hypothetical protein